MYETFKRFTNDSLFAAHGADPYVQSHPMPAERVAALEEIARSSPYWEKKDDPALQLRHDMVRAKISAFMERQDTVYRRYPMSNDSLPARYAHAISTYLHGDLRSALAQIDALIQLQPANPYFYELRGQALLEGGKPAEAVAPLRRAVQLSNNAPLIEMLLGQALVGTDNKTYTDEAITILRAAVARETESAARLYPARDGLWPKGDFAQADLASAQAAFLRGDNKTARELASRAKTRFAVGNTRMGQGRRHRRCKADARPKQQLELVEPGQEGFRTPAFTKRICPCLRFACSPPSCSLSRSAACCLRPRRRVSPTVSAGISRPSSGIICWRIPKCWKRRWPN